MRTKQTARPGRTIALRGSVEQVWLAGLGALAVAEEEGEEFFKSLRKRGQTIERTLVKKGTGLEKELVRRREEMQRAGRERLRRAAAMADDATGGAMQRIGNGIDGTMTTVLHRLGIPTAKEIASLTKRVEVLTTTLSSGKPARRPPAKRARVRRATTRRTTPTVEQATA